VSIWRSPRSLDELNAAAERTLSRQLGMVFTEIGEDFIRATMPVDERTWQPMGLLHGGASVALAETLGSVGGNMCMERPEHGCVGQEINANHIRSVSRGLVTGTARPLHLGGRTQVWAIEIVDESARLICVSRLTLAVIKRPPT
jgi:1,4-dihydroxy-2-naphthoyl-CoA hydrolase